MTRVTRALVAREREKLFANSPGFNAGVPIAGREQELMRLAQIVSGETDSHVVRLSDLLGAGKTFFIQAGKGHLQQADLVDEETETAHVDYRHLASVLGISGLKLLVVDELDRKAGRDDILSAVESAAKWAAEGAGERFLVLTGDYSLRNDELESITGTPEPLELAPLDKPLFRRAIALRVRKALRQIDRDSDVDDEAREAAETMFDDALLTALLPPTDPPVATFREALGIAQTLAGVLPIDDQPCRLTPETYRDLAAVEAARRRPPAQTEFLDNLYSAINPAALADRRWPAMHVQEFPWLSHLDDDAAAQYERTVIDALIRAKLLLPMGVPYSGPTGRRTPGPYLPTGRAFLAAAFGNGVGG